FSMLAPCWFTWYVFAFICTFITLYKCYNLLKSTFIWDYEKVVDATNYLIGKLSNLIWEDQSETNAAEAKLEENWSLIDINNFLISPRERVFYKVITLVKSYNSAYGGKNMPSEPI
ncbi:hypothetical protein Tco_1279632, partial [Tanacetum coccineum]